MIFTDGDDYTQGPFPIVLPQRCVFTPIEVSFAMPQYWIAIDHPGLNNIQLLYDGKPFFFSKSFHLFGGLVSEQPFDAAIILNIDSDLVPVDELT